MSTSAETERWPQRARRSTIHAGVGAFGSTFETTRPEKRPHRSPASIRTGGRWQLRADLGARHLDAGAHVGRAAHDFERPLAAGVDDADAEAVRIRMACHFEDTADDDAAERRRDRAGLLDLHAGHREEI